MKLYAIYKHDHLISVCDNMESVNSMVDSIYKSDKDLFYNKEQFLSHWIKVMSIEPNKFYKDVIDEECVLNGTLGCN